MVASILTTKLNIPKPRPQIVLRERLISRLGSRQAGKLTLISAPAGFGKTTLASEWARSLDQSVGWLSLDESDNDIIRFLSYFIASLQALDKDIGQEELKKLRSPHPPAVEEQLISILNQINDLPKRVVLFLDDYHFIFTQSIHEAVTYILDHLPENMHLVIVSRADPPLPLARLRGRGEVAEIRQADLRFTLDEATVFLEKVMGLKIGIDTIRALNTRTEGWIAGLQMAAVSMQDQEDVSNFVRILSGSNRYILDYLIEEVLQRQPEGVQQFLLQTSVLDRLTSPLCDAILSGSGDWEVKTREDMQLPDTNFQSQIILEYLEKANLFIYSLDDHRQWFRYHRLFRDLLRKRFQQLFPDLIPGLHRRASDWLEQAGFLPDAIEHALKAEDFERAAQLVEQVGEEMLMRSEVGTFVQWLEKLPEEILKHHPHLQLFQAWTLIVTGASLDVIENQLQNIADEGEILSARVAAIRAYLAIYQGDLHFAWELSHVAWEQLPEADFFLRGILSMIFGISLLAKGDLEAGTKSLIDVFQISQQVDNVMVGTLTLSHLARLRKRAGDLDEAHKLYQRAVELATDDSGDRLPIAGEAYMGLGDIWLQWNDLDKAEKYILRSIHLTEAWSDAAALEGYLALAHVRQAQRRIDEVGPLIEKARKLAMKFETTDLDDIMVDISEARLTLLGGDVEAANRWIEARGVELYLQSEQWFEGETSLRDHIRKYELIILSRILIAQGKPQRALEILTQLLEMVKSLQRMDLVIEVLILQVIAQDIDGNLDEAVKSLNEALSLAEPGNYTRIFVNEGPVMAKLLYEALQRGISSEYCGRLLSAFPEEEQEPFTGGPLESEMVEPLSPREIEVLSLIAEGLSNREIADHLYLTLGTVKVHTRNIFGKLCVNNRTHAVAKARFIGIL